MEAPQSNSGLADMATLTSQLCSGEFLVPEPGITDRLPHSPDNYVGSEDPNFCAHACSAIA